MPLPLLVDPLLCAYAQRRECSNRALGRKYARGPHVRAHAVAFYYTAKGPPEPSIIARSAQSNALGDAHWIIFVSYQTATRSRVRGKIFKQIMADCVKQFRGSLLLKRTPTHVPPSSKRTCRQEQRTVFFLRIFRISHRNSKREPMKKSPSAEFYREIKFIFALVSADYFGATCEDIS